MNNSKRVILITIFKILVKGKKHYIGPSVNTLIDLICSYHSTKIRRRWAFQCLHDLEAQGYLNRRTRFLRLADGTWKQIPSLISITLVGARKLYAQGVDGAARLIKEILGWIHSGDKRWPGYKNTLTKPASRESVGGFSALGDILKSINQPEVSMG